jgi:hypothetical protein
LVTQRAGARVNRDNGQTVMVTHTETEKKDGKDHLYGQTMIARMSPQQENFHKRRSTRNRCSRTKRNRRSHHKNKGPTRRNPWVDRNRRRIQGKKHHKPAKMVRMKKTHVKRNTQMDENPISHRKISRMEQAARDAKGTFQALVEPEGSSDHHQMGEGNHSQAQGQSLGGTEPGSRLDNGPRDHAVQGNTLPQDGRDGMANKDVNRQSEHRKESFQPEG